MRPLLWGILRTCAHVALFRPLLWGLLRTCVNMCEYYNKQICLFTCTLNKYVSHPTWTCLSSQINNIWINQPIYNGYRIRLFCVVKATWTCLSSQMNNICMNQPIHDGYRIRLFCVVKAAWTGLFSQTNRSVLCVQTTWIRLFSETKTFSLIQLPTKDLQLVYFV